MIKLLLTTLMDLLENHKDHCSGQTGEDLLHESQKRFAQALNNYIDYRIQEAFDERRRLVSQERITMADSINSSMKSTASSVRSMAALSSAPTPPMGVSDPKVLEQWTKDYNEWYEQKRNHALTIK